jgi:hypothetical protein
MAKRIQKPRGNAPGRGGKVSVELQSRFRAAYLKHGYLSGAAREVKLPISTCAKFADQAEADPAFVQARKDLLTRGLDRVEAMLIRASEIAAERIESGPQVDAMGGIVDNGPQYFRGLSDAHRSLAARKAKESPDEPKGPLEIVFRRAAVPSPPEPAGEPVEVTPPDAAG